MAASLRAIVIIMNIVVRNTGVKQINTIVAKIVPVEVVGFILILTTATIVSLKTITLVGRGMVIEYRMVGLTANTILGRLHIALPMIMASHCTTAS